MKHLATIQSEFLKEARNWDDLSLEEQKGYLSRHPKSKRKLTAKPSTEQSADKPTKSIVKSKSKKFDDMSFDEQKEFRSQHPSSKRRITAEPDYDVAAFLKVKGNDPILTERASMSLAQYKEMSKYVTRPSYKKYLSMMGKRLVDDGQKHEGPTLSTIFKNGDLYIDGDDIVLNDEEIGKVGKSTYNDIAKQVPPQIRIKLAPSLKNKLKLYGVKP